MARFAITKCLVGAASLSIYLDSPASAQADPGVQGPPSPPKIIRDCRNVPKDEIVVCGTQERSPYRLPEPSPRFDPQGGVDSVSRERNNLFDVGETGIGSCSNVGPGGPFGCTFKQWKHKEQQSQGHRVRKGLIEKIIAPDEPEPLPGR